MSKSTSPPPPPPTAAAPAEPFESALVDVESAKGKLQAAARELPNPPTVEVELKGQKKRELASAAGAEPTAEEQQLGAAERSIERLDEVAEDLRGAGSISLANLDITYLTFTDPPRNLVE